MESGYFYVDWNSIPGLYNRKSYLRTLVIAKEEWDHLSNPAQLKHYWEPTQDPDDFHRTLGLALCWTPFHDCSEPTQKKEYVMSVAVVRKPAWHLRLPFAAATFQGAPTRTSRPSLDDICSGSSITARYTVKSKPYCKRQPGSRLSPSHP